MSILQKGKLHLINTLPKVSKTVNGWTDCIGVFYFKAYVVSIFLGRRKKKERLREGRQGTKGIWTHEFFPHSLCWKEISGKIVTSRPPAFHLLLPFLELDFFWIYCFIFFQKLVWILVTFCTYMVDEVGIIVKNQIYVKVIIINTLVVAHVRDL